jgi:hypothetical protein
VGEAKIVKAVVPVPLATRVIGDSINRFTPRGVVPIQDEDNTTVPPNPLMDLTVTVAEPLPPSVTLTFDGEVSEKSGEATVELVLLVVVCILNGTVTENVVDIASSLGFPIAVTT